MIFDDTDVGAIERRRLLKAGGFGLTVLVSARLLRSPLGSVVDAMASRPLAIAPNVEVQVFQTAASLENLAIAAYASALELPFVQGDATILQFVETTLQQHTEHAALFNDQAEGLGGERPERREPAVLPARRDLRADDGRCRLCGRVGCHISRRSSRTPTWPT